MTLGNPPLRKGDNYEGRVSEVPIELLQSLVTRPIPVTLSGTSNRVFTLNASTTRPVAIWNGDDFIFLKSSVAYTWTASGTQEVLSSAGAETTEAEGGQTAGIYYMYLDNDGSEILPSQTAPSYVETSYQCGVLGHPGTSRAKNWIYVGFMICTAATPTFLSATKVGYTYHITRQSGATISSYVANDEFRTILPNMRTQGVTVSGYIETGTAGFVLVSADSTGSSFGNIKVGAVGSSAMFAPFTNLPVGTSGDLYTYHTGAAGDVHITMIHDVV